MNDTQGDGEACRARATTRALVVSRYFPFSSQKVSGAFQRLGTQVQALARVVDRVHCLFLVPVEDQYAPEAVAAHEARLQRLWSPAISIQLASTLVDDEAPTVWGRVGRPVFDFHAQPVARPANRPAAIDVVNAALDARPVIVLAHQMSAMCVLMTIAHRAPPGTLVAPIYFDLDDIGHIGWLRRLLRYPAWPRERLHMLQVPRLLLAEIQAIRLAAATFVCSDADRLYLQRFPGARNVVTIPNSTIIPELEAGDCTEPLVLFIGAMGVPGNVQGVEVLVREVWPAVRARLPDARLVIIGTGAKMPPSSSVADPSITFTGFVDDLAPWYRRARVVCCPIYQGAGTRVKIIEAAAHGKAVVSTRIGAEGLEFADGREITLREKPAELAAACVRLLSDANLAASFGRAAREKARVTYDRTSAINKLATIFRAGLSTAADDAVTSAA